MAGPVQLVPAGEYARTFGHGALHQLVDLVYRFGVDHRAKLGGRVFALAHGQRGHPVGQPLGEFIIDLARDVEPVRRGAGLAPVAHLGHHGPVERLGDVGIGADKERRVAAQFHRRGQHLIRRFLEQDTPHLG